MSRRERIISLKGLKVEEIKLTEEEKKMLSVVYEKAKHIFCDCDDPIFGTYPEDGKCSCGMYKHHVHCATCGKILQIG